jgi:hypothetical protein
MSETDAQKKEIDQAEEPLQDLTPEKDAAGGNGGGPRVRVFDGVSLNAGASLDAQKKEDA